jgi:hypothetical protein
MSTITDETLGPKNQLLLTEKSSATDQLQLDATGESKEPQIDRAIYVSTILKSIPGYIHGGLNE